MQSTLIIVAAVASFLSGYGFAAAWNGVLLQRKRYCNDGQRRRPTPLPVPQIPVPGRNQEPRQWCLTVEPSVDRLNTVITVKGEWHELPLEELGEFLADMGEHLQGARHMSTTENER